MSPMPFRYLDMVAKLAQRLGTRDVLYFDPSAAAMAADLVVSVCPPKHAEVLDGIAKLMNRMAMIFVHGSVEWWIKEISARFNILYADPGWEYPVFFVEHKHAIPCDFPQHETALYDLANRPATFDVFTWLAVAKTFGAKHVRFVTGGWKKKNYTEEQAQRRFDSIVKPAVELYGLSYSIGEPCGVTYSHVIDAAVRTYKEFGRIEKIPHPVTMGDYVTVTLRKSRTPERDSREEEWLRFAQLVDRRCVVVRDYEEKPLPLEDRWRLYAGAYMNLFVNNGPAILGILSEVPYLVMRYIGDDKCLAASPKAMAEAGITEGFQYPWRNDRQRLSYRLDTCENIGEEYARMPHLEQRLAA